MEVWKNFLDKEIKIIYEDGGRFPSKKQGILIGFTETHLVLRIKFRVEALLLTKVIRCEVQEVENE